VRTGRQTTGGRRSPGPAHRLQRPRRRAGDRSAAPGRRPTPFAGSLRWGAD